MTLRPPSSWSVFAAAPHRVLFLPGALQGVLVMLWWLVDMAARQAGGSGLAQGGVPALLLHGWSMLFGFFPFFVFGFLFTAAPNWLSGPRIGRPAYLGAAAGMSLGVVSVYAGLPLVGLALHLAGWLVGLAGLLTTLRGSAEADKRHAWAAWTALAMGALAEATMLAGLLLERLDWWRGAFELVTWGCLVPLFLTVCHRMIPWFTSRVVPDYVLVRPYGLLWALWAGALLHAALAVGGWSHLTWSVDLSLAGLVLWLARRWDPVRGFRVRLLAMLHVAFLWAGASFLLHGLDGLAGLLGWDWSAGRAPLHGLGIGFFGAMLVGMASRVSLGHSGLALEADAATWRLFWLVQVAALLRMTPDLANGFGRDGLIPLAGGVWLVAFGWWAWKYAPLYWRPRADGKPG